MRSIDVKGLYQLNDRDFVAIAPVWCPSYRFNVYPVHHYRFVGKWCNGLESIDRAHFNPENVYSDEPWVEVEPYLIRHQSDHDRPDTGWGWGIARRSSCCRYHDGNWRHSRFFLPKAQLRQFYEMEPRSPQPVELNFSYGTYELSHATCYN